MPLERDISRRENAMPHLFRSLTRNAVLALALAVAAPSFGQQPTLNDSLLDHMAGNWVLEGTIRGKETTHDVSAEWVLGHQYLRIHEVSRDLNAKGEPAYEANVYLGWDGNLQEYACVWLDVYGGVSPVSIGNGKRAGDEIPFEFKDKDSDLHTTFRYRAGSDTWDWAIDNEANGKRSPFARLTLRRVK
jgi:hypothetical protein